MKYIQFFQRRTIEREDGIPYLHRITLLGLGPDGRWFSIKLHKIVSSDDVCLHDHPWAFISIVLKGGYTEYTKLNSPVNTFYEKGWGYHGWSERNQFHVIKKYFKPGSILFRKAHWAHRLEVGREPATTLVLTFRRKRKWGFFTSKGWIYWRKYNTKTDC